MRANYDALTSAENSARFHVYCLDRQSALILRRDNSAFAITELPYGRGSWGHAQAIERAIQSIVPGEINIIADSDVVLLMKNWDKPLVEAMIEKKSYGIVGTRLEDIGGVESRDIKKKTKKKKKTTTNHALYAFLQFLSLSFASHKQKLIYGTNE